MLICKVLDVTLLAGKGAPIKTQLQAVQMSTTERNASADNNNNQTLPGGKLRWEYKHPWSVWGVVIWLDPNVQHASSRSGRVEDKPGTYPGKTLPLCLLCFLHCNASSLHLSPSSHHPSVIPLHSPTHSLALCLWELSPFALFSQNSDPQRFF